MGRKCLWIVGTIMIFLFSGCASLKCLDGSCERQIKELTVTSDDLKKEMAKLDADNKDKDKIIKSNQDEIAALNKDRTALNARIKDLQDDVLKMRKQKDEGAAAIKSETLTEKQTAPKAEAAVGKGDKKTEQAKSIKIKVLAGDGRLASARLMARKLEKTGLKVEIVDLAPRADFSADTVYYLRDCEKEAREIAGSVGEKTLLKRMTWPSAFNIIVVTGKK
jgi:chromosome segregation ATPase